MKTYLLTGSTGTLGVALFDRFLQAGHALVLLARRSHSATRRTLLNHFNRFETFPKLLPREDRLRILTGDVSRPAFGLTPSAIKEFHGKIEAVIHCAAKVTLDDRRADETFRVNVDGAKNLKQTARLLGCRHIHHISTAYVGGKSISRLDEAPNTGTREFNNAYEKSKWEAEQILWQWNNETDRLLTVYRPSLIVGNSQNGWIPRFNGFYNYVRAVARVANQVPSSFTNYFEQVGFRTPGSENAQVNLVPIDFVVEAIYRVVTAAKCASQTIHLVSENSMDRDAIQAEIDQAFKVVGPRFVPWEDFDSQPMSPLESKFHSKTRNFAPYINGAYKFETRRSRQVLGQIGLAFPHFDLKSLRRSLNYYQSIHKSREMALQWA